jgi:glucose/arabinose dehydrogenase
MTTLLASGSWLLLSDHLQKSSPDPMMLPMDMLLGRGLSYLCRGILLALVVVVSGCIRGPAILAPHQQQVIDRSVVEYPPGYELRTFVEHLTAPSAIAFDPDAFSGKGAILIAESGIGGKDTRIFGYTKGEHDYFDKYFEIYPRDVRVPSFGLIRPGFVVKGPIGGMTVAQGKIFVTHRDFDDNGVVTAFDYSGGHKTIASDFPAQGEHSLTDIVVKGDRVYFGLGAATNSGVVGPDDWQIGWVKKHPKFSDQPLYPLKLLGYRFDAKNPRSGLLGGDDIARTAPFLPFGVSDLSWVPKAPDGKPTAAIYSASVAGGDVRVEAHGIRLPRGLAVDEWGGGRIYFTNNGMELRGTRPVKDDPDALLRLVPGQTWYGWPDFSADLQPIGQPRYQPPLELMRGSGYREIYNLIDHAASNPPKGLQNPDMDRNALLQAVFPSLSGAAKMTFIPNTGPFKQMQGNLLVALSGDRAPFATSGAKNFMGSSGYRVAMVNLDTERGKVTDFVKNTENKPASQQGRGVVALERPVDVKFGPDGSLYILDLGPLEVKNGKENVPRFGGRIFVLKPEATASATTEPAR